MEICPVTPGARPALECFRQFGRKSAAGRLIAIPPATLPAVWPLLGAIDNIGIGSRCCRLRRQLLLLLLLRSAWRRGALGGLRRIRAQQAVFERRAIETADN